VDDTLIACEDGCPGDLAASLTSESTFSFTWSGTEGAKVLDIQYVYNGPKNAFWHLQIEVNGKAVEGNALLETTRGTTVAQEGPFLVTLASGDNVTLGLLDWDCNAFYVDGVKVYEDVRGVTSSYS